MNEFSANQSANEIDPFAVFGSDDDDEAEEEQEEVQAQSRVKARHLARALKDI